MLLSGQFNTSILILGRPGTCEEYGFSQFYNDRYSYETYVCYSRDDCGDNRVKLKTTVAFCGMLLDTFVSLTEIFSVTCYDSLNYMKTNVNSLRVALKKGPRRFF